MKKIFSIVLAVLMLFSLAACGEKQTEVNLSEVKTKITEDAGISGAMDVSADRLLDLYGIKAESIKQSACFVTMDGVFPDEIIMIEAVDDAAASEIEEKLQNRLAEVKNQAASYDAENYALAQKCTVNKRGNFVSMFLSSDYEAIQKIYDGFVK